MDLRISFWCTNVVIVKLRMIQLLTIQDELILDLRIVEMRGKTSAGYSFVVYTTLLIMQVKSFETKKEVDEWLFNNPTRCPGALHFEEKSPTVISYGIQTNSTQVPKRKQFEDATFKFQIPLQVAAEREISRSLIGGIRYGITLRTQCSML